jgi:hypothetical protein
MRHVAKFYQSRPVHMPSSNIDNVLDIVPSEVFLTRMRFEFLTAVKMLMLVF